MTDIYPNVGDTCLCEKCKTQWQLTLADAYGTRDTADFAARFSVVCPDCLSYDVRRIERATPPSSEAPAKKACR